MPFSTRESRWGKAGASRSKVSGDMLPSGMPPMPFCFTHMPHCRLQRVVTSTKSLEGCSFDAMFLF